MVSKQGWQLIWQITLIWIIPFRSFAATDNPCGGTDSFLTILNRPSVADSPCVVPNKKVLLELGYQYQKLRYQGHAQNFPAAELRLGLPADTEFFTVLPNYTTQSILPHSGFGPTSLGFKHEITYTSKWVATMEASLTPPSGSMTFGNKGWGGVLSGIFIYEFNKKLSLSCMLGVSSETQSSFDGGQRFTSVKPDAVLTWSLKDNLQFFGEIYGQSKTGPHEGSGFNFDAGFIYLAAKNVAVDIEAGQRLRGVLGRFENYVGAGMAIQF